MSEREEYDSEHCRECNKHCYRLTDHFCSKCHSNHLAERELSDKMQTKTIDLTKANNKATK